MHPSPNKVAQVFTDIKHKLQIGQHSNVVYRIPCKQCGKYYIGENTRNLCERCVQHEKDVENISKKPKKTALVAHVSEMKHKFDSTKAEVFKKVRNKGLLKIQEANQIILYEDTVVNFKKDAKHVSPIFYNLIRRSKVRKERQRVNPTSDHTLNRSNSTNSNERSSDDCIYSRTH